MLFALTYKIRLAAPGKHISVNKILRREVYTHDLISETLTSVWCSLRTFTVEHVTAGKGS
jgi:hypothetical protein